MEVREPSVKYLVGQSYGQLSNWREVKLGDVAAFKTGPFGSSLHKSDYVFGGVPVVNPMQIEDGRIRSTDRMSVAECAAERLSEFRLHFGDVVIGRRGEMGRCAFVEVAQHGWLCGTGSMIVRCGPELNARFVQRLLSSNQIVRAIENASVGTTMINLNQSTLGNLILHVPADVAEQSTIADALTDTDALIDSMEQLLTKKRQIKQGTMQELLTGKRRLPGFKGGWNEMRIFDLAERKKDFFDDGDWIESEHIKTEGIRLIQTGNIGVGLFLEKAEKKFINDDSFNLLKCKELKVGDLLICRLADPAGRACVLPDIGEERVVTSVDVTIFRPPSSLASREFLAQVFSTPEWFKAVSDLSGGTTHKRIARGALGRMSVLLPSLSEQQAIAQILSDMDNDIAAIETRLTKARDLKQAMAQALLTGRIRLVETKT